MSKISIIASFVCMFQSAFALVGPHFDPLESIINPSAKKSTFVPELKPCPSLNLGLASDKLFRSALLHISAFDEVRDSLLLFDEMGYEVCASGVPLENDMSKNYRFFSRIEVREKGEIILDIPTLYTSPSIQADHGISNRPWVALSAQKMEEFLEAIASDFRASVDSDGLSLESIGNLPKTLESQPWWTSEIQKTFQLMPLVRQGDLQYFVGGWMLLQDAGATLYAQSYAPKMVVLRWNSKLKKVSISRPTSSFGKILTPATDLLNEASKALRRLKGAQKAEAFRDLGL